MKKRNSDEKGFTLIELIVTLVLVGISAAMAGMWISSVAQGYFYAKTGMDTTQKAQLAMTRLSKELAAISVVTASSASGITYNRPDSPTTAPLTGQTISLSGELLQLNGNTLTDDVSAFTLAYCDDATAACSASWSSTSRIIEITLKLKGANNTFTQRVAPRNL